VAGNDPAAIMTGRRTRKAARVRYLAPM